MLLTIPDTILPTVSVALRLYAAELASTCADATHKLDHGIAFVAEPEIERARLNVLRMESETLVLVARLIDTQLGVAERDSA